MSTIFLFHNNCCQIVDKIVDRKAVKFDEIRKFQNLPKSFNIAMASFIWKVQKYDIPLWKASEIWISKSSKSIKICEKITEI